jgi:hypothetical protein
MFARAGGDMSAHVIRLDVKVLAREPVRTSLLGS